VDLDLGGAGCLDGDQPVSLGASVCQLEIAGADRCRDGRFARPGMADLERTGRVAVGGGGNRQQDDAENSKQGSANAGHEREHSTLRK
jgi:hypothetical protein